jgi:hypothetical protein
MSKSVFTPSCLYVSSLFVFIRKSSLNTVESVFCPRWKRHFPLCYYLFYVLLPDLEYPKVVKIHALDQMVCPLDQMIC